MAQKRRASPKTAARKPRKRPAAPAVTQPAELRYIGESDVPREAIPEYVEATVDDSVDEPVPAGLTALVTQDESRSQVLLLTLFCVLGVVGLVLFLRQFALYIAQLHVGP